MDRTTKTAEIEEKRCSIPHSSVEISTAVEAQQIHIWKQPEGSA